MTSAVHARREQRLLIVDPTLISYEGHSYNYDIAVATAACECGVHVEIYADRRFRHSGDVCQVHSCLNMISMDRLKNFANAIFSTLRKKTPNNTRQNNAANATVVASVPQWVVNLGKRLRAFDFSVSLRRLLRSAAVPQGCDLHVLVQHVSMGDLVGFESVLRRCIPSWSGIITFHLVLRYEPAIICFGYESLDRFMVRLKRLADYAGNSGLRVCYYTDSQALSVAYAKILSELRFATLPIPTLTRISCGAMRLSSTAGVLRLAMLGSSRMEKGFGHVQDILESLPFRIGEYEIELRVQVNRDTSDPRVLAITSWLDSYVEHRQPDRPKLTLLTGPAPHDEYFSWFKDTDILLAPYVSTKYTASTSGVFVEALYFGIPTVAMRGTWIASKIEDARNNGLKIGEIADDLGAVCDMAKVISRDLERYRSDVYLYLDDWHSFNTPANFVSILFSSSAC